MRVRACTIVAGSVVVAGSEVVEGRVASVAAAGAGVAAGSVAAAGAHAWLEGFVPSARGAAEGTAGYMARRRGLGSARPQLLENPVRGTAS